MFLLYRFDLMHIVCHPQVTNSLPPTQTVITFAFFGHSINSFGSINADTPEQIKLWQSATCSSSLIELDITWHFN